MHVYSSMSKLDYIEHDCNIYNTKQKNIKQTESSQYIGTPTSQ